MDFGIARAVADTSATMTQTAAVIGTAQYLSPEQARGETVDARSDIYSAGCLLYELLVGRPPFTGDSPVSVAYQHVREAPVPPSQLDPVITPDIDAVTLKALAKDPLDRYQSAREMKADISRVLAGQQATAVVPRVAAPVPDVGPTRVVPAAVVASADGDEQDEEVPGRRARVIAGVVALVLLLVGLGAFGLYRALAPAATPAVVQVEVPAVLTYTEAQARAQLADRRLQAVVRRDNGPDDETKNTITAQDPAGGTQVPENSKVTLTLNVGPKTARVPGGLVGSDVDVAAKKLEDAGFTNVSKKPAGTESSDAREDQVLRVDPGEGDTVALDDEITLTFATGESEVPVLTGKTAAQAISDAMTAGFSRVKTVTETTSKETADVVFKQNPEAGRREKRSKQIVITVAKAPAPPSPSPTPTPTPTPSPGKQSPTPSDTPG
jgi:serine/threonine-protein kinase